jgi:hypothetical protein
LVFRPIVGWRRNLSTQRQSGKRLSGSDPLAAAEIRRTPAQGMTVSKRIETAKFRFYGRADRSGRILVPLRMRRSAAPVTA